MIEDASTRARKSVEPIVQQGLFKGMIKLLVHGFVLTILTYILFVGWNSFVGNGGFGFQLSIPGLLGFSLSFLVLIIGGGWSNIKISDLMWDFRTGKLLTDYLVQGLFLALPMFLSIELFTWVSLWFIFYGSSFSAVVILFGFILLTIVLGFIGRSVAFWFRDPGPTFDQPPLVQGGYGATTVVKKNGERIVFHGTRSICPKCRKSDRYYEEERSREGMVECRKCGHYFYIEPIESLLEKLGEDVEPRYTTEL
ncbi:MAG: hypothetical protein ACFFCP_07230 [Promethearchaeota archaeon]